MCIAFSSEARELKFNKKGEFKIVQFTDVHFCLGNPKSDIALERIREVIRREKPDLVAFTGDIVYSVPAVEGMKTVLSIVSKAGIPFFVVFGNHDKEFDATNEQLYDMILTLDNNMHPERGDAPACDFDLVVRKRDGSIGTVLYCIDSHSYNWTDKYYEWITQEQIDAYKKRSADYTAANGGSPIPSLAFFHIPIPEFGIAASDQSAHLVGTRKEVCCCPEYNSGMFAAMKECGDIKAVFVGHDHDDDYSVMWDGILLSYGRYTGGDTVYNNLSNGARVILLHEDGGLDTWVVLKGGRRLNDVSIPF
ncbi:MAG: metallophosphoesterase family protein [Bacteroidales bacterium]|nr:metallophosphoesterase family protein [Bacteroidales bacterium]